MLNKVKEKKNKRMRDLTKGNIIKVMFFFSLPILLGNVFQQAYNLADIIIVGKKLGDMSLSAVGSTASVVSLLFNIINGTMSFVGPRPTLPYQTERYTERQKKRHDMRPGITGWAQVNGRNMLSWEDKFAHDVWYVDHRSLALDFKILVLTVLAVFRASGISAAGEATMGEFKGGNQ